MGPEEFKAEIKRIAAGLLRTPAEEKLAYLKREVAQFQEPYRSAAEALLLTTEVLSDNPPPAGPAGFLKEAIRAVPAVRYALGVGGVVSAIVIVGSFGISYRVAVVGFLITLVLMALLVVFAKLADANAHYFVIPFLCLTWFAIFAMIATVTLIFTGVFFKWPLDLHSWLVKG